MTSESTRFRLATLSCQRREDRFTPPLSFKVPSGQDGGRGVGVYNFSLDLPLKKRDLLFPGKMLQIFPKTHQGSNPPPPGVGFGGSHLNESHGCFFPRGACYRASAGSALERTDHKWWTPICGLPRFLSSKTKGPGEEGAAGYCPKILLPNRAKIVFFP